MSTAPPASVSESPLSRMRGGATLVTSVAQIVITSPPETFEARIYLPQLMLRQIARMAATLGRDRARD